MKSLQAAPGLKWKPAITRGSYQAKVNACPQYSLQEVEPDTGLFHGIANDCICYRSNAGDPPTIKADPADVKQAETATAKPPAGFTSTFESSTSVVDSLPDSSMTHSISVMRRDPLRKPPTATLGTTSSNDSSETSSPRKRYFPSEQNVTEATTASDESTGQQTFTPKIASVTQSDDSAEQQASPAKKVKVTQSDLKVETRACHSPLTSHTLLQSFDPPPEERKESEVPKQSFAEATRETTRSSGRASDPSKDSRSAIYTARMLMKCSGLADPADNNAASPQDEQGRIGGSDRSEIRTLTMKIPKFADPDAVKGERCSCNRVSIFIGLSVCECSRFFIIH